MSISSNHASSSNVLYPPISIQVPVNPNLLVRYNRDGHNDDAESAVVGKGGFGTVYRYRRDESFDASSSSSSSSSGSSFHHSSSSYLESESVGDGFPYPQVRSPYSGVEYTPSLTFTESTSTQSSRPPTPSNKFLQLPQVDEIHPFQQRSSTCSPNRLNSHGAVLHHNSNYDALQNRASAVVVVKVCKTPCTGSFDELQRTGLLEKKQRKAMLNDDSRKHIRIVRGEARIFHYLQACQQTKFNMSHANVVRMLANLPTSGQFENDSQLASSLENQDGPPARVLVFESMVELDYQLTGKGWEQSKKPWSFEQVEKTALEVIRGLRFLHAHNITHGDLKPSNLMKCPKTGTVKIIDLGASRRFVQLPNTQRDNTRAVEQRDSDYLDRGETVPSLEADLCEGLGSLTGSPHYMAPEVLLQSSRYTDNSGRSRSILEDYQKRLGQQGRFPETECFKMAFSDLMRGWGIRSDIWSWACTVQALALRTLAPGKRPNTSVVCPFDFSFSKHQHEMLESLYPLAKAELNLPRFHVWSRHHPLHIMDITIKGVELRKETEGCSLALQQMVCAALQHQDQRPSATQICNKLDQEDEMEICSFDSPRDYQGVLLETTVGCECDNTHSVQSKARQSLLGVQVRETMWKRVTYTSTSALRSAKPCQAPNHVSRDSGYLEGKYDKPGRMSSLHLLVPRRLHLRENRRMKDGESVCLTRGLGIDYGDSQPTPLQEAGWFAAPPSFAAGETFHPLSHSHSPYSSFTNGTPGRSSDLPWSGQQPAPEKGSTEAMNDTETYGKKMADMFPHAGKASEMQTRTNKGFDFERHGNKATSRTSRRLSSVLSRDSRTMFAIGETLPFLPLALRKSASSLSFSSAKLGLGRNSHRDSSFGSPDSNSLHHGRYPDKFKRGKILQRLDTFTAGMFAKRR